MKSVCDFIIDCRLAEDEYGCNLIACPGNCSCLNYAMSCSNIYLPDLGWKLPFDKILVENLINVISVRHIEESCEYVKILIMSRASVKSICGLSIKASFFEVTFTNVSEVDKGCFSHTPIIQNLNLSHNVISVFKCGGFFHENNVISLDISFNQMESIAACMLSSLTSLKLLAVQGNKLRHVHVKAFLFNHKLLRIITNSFHVCCMATNVNKDVACNIKPKWPSSCSDLLTNVALKLFIWMFAFCIVVFNITSISISIGSIVIKRKTSFRVLVLGISWIDIPYGIYLLILACADAWYMGRFVTHEEIWRESFVCHMMSALSLFSCLGSVVGLNLITLSRLMVILHPLTSTFKRAKFNSKLILAGLGTVILFTVASILTHFANFQYTRNGDTYKQPSVLCTVFGAQDKSASLIAVNIVLSVIQLSSIFSIVLMNITLIREMNSPNVVKETVRERRNRTVCKKIIVATFTNILTWLPSSVIYLVSAALEKYPTELLAWNLVAIIPINPAFNPLIFNLSRPRIHMNPHKQLDRDHTKD